MAKTSALAVASTVAVILVGGILWSLNYALAYWYVSRSWTMWEALAADWFAPLNQALAYWDQPIVRKLALLAAAGVVVELALLAAGMAALIFQPWRIKPPADGSRFGTLTDLRKAGLLDGKPGHSVLLGTYQGRDVRYSGDSHFYVNGPSRSGKGRGFVMTNLLEWSGSIIVLDVKLENWNKTGPVRAAMGQEMYLFAPGSEKSHRWNPLDFVRPWPARATDVLNLAAALIPAPARGETYWAETAQGLLAGLMAYVLESRTMEGRRTIRSVLRMFGSGMSLSNRISAIISSEPDLHSFILDNFWQHLGRDDKQKTAFESQVTTNLKAWNNRLLADVTSTSDFDIRNLRRNRMSIYIGAPVSDFATVEPIIRLFIQQVHDVLLRHEPTADEPHKLFLMLDEFYQFGRLPEIVMRAPLVAGYGFRIAVIAQNLPQLDERYTKVTREALVGNMDVRLYIGVGDDTTADAVSRDFGRQYVERQGWSRGQGRHNVQGRWEPVPVISADAVKRLDDKKTLLHVRGHYGVALDKLNFYKDQRFVNIVERAASYGTFLEVPAVPPVDEWPLSEARPAAEAKNPHAAAVDQSETAAWLMVEKLVAVTFHDTTPVMARLRKAMAHPDDVGIAVISHELRTNPMVCGELLGRLRLGGQPDRDRASALNAATQLRTALIAMRRRQNNRDAANYRSLIQAQKPALLQDSVEPEDTFGPVILTPPSPESSDPDGATIASVLGIVERDIGEDTRKLRRFTALRSRLDLDIHEFADDDVS